ncbi:MULTISPECIES: hypothetical protein [Burkholderia]|uniref:Uncharacterized protein n=1 Tax=Burkholderia sola TaxID=2843302 RepID=A0ABV2CGT9_9BURK|nr:hypothetical protein [Burkholderia sp. CpTa8-5]MBP0610319.1 hypothetical protein [Burkholderia sp. CpTa8-5]
MTVSVPGRIAFIDVAPRANDCAQDENKTFMYYSDNKDHFQIRVRNGLTSEFHYVLKTVVTRNARRPAPTWVLAHLHPLVIAHIACPIASSVIEIGALVRRSIMPNEGGNAPPAGVGRKEHT